MEWSSSCASHSARTSRRFMPEVSSPPNFQRSNILTELGRLQLKLNIAAMSRQDEALVFDVRAFR